VPLEGNAVFRFVHAADLHLDTPFQAMVRATPTIADALRDASLDAFDSLVQLAIDREAAFLVIAGDVYDGSERGVRAQFRFLRGLERLSAHGIQTLVVHGNHDPVDGWSAIRGQWPDGVTVFGHTGVETVPIDRNGNRLATVYGVSYPTRAVAENLSLRFRRTPDPGIHIGLLHCNVGGDRDHEAYSPCSLDDLRQAQMDYWALGHIHKRQVLSPHGPSVVYPGNTQGRSHKPSEMGPKGAMVVTVDGQMVRPPEFVPLDRVRFVGVEVDVARIADLPALSRALMGHAGAARAEHGNRGLLLRAVLKGRGPVHRDLSRPNAVDELLRDLRDAAETDEPFLWWESIRRETQPDLDRSVIRQRGDFASELLRRSEDIRANPESTERFGAAKLDALPPSIVQFLSEDLNGSHAALLQSAEDLALDMLEGNAS
jgi:DNA repair exonuclease SbcCD nuclease subunit